MALTTVDQSLINSTSFKNRIINGQSLIAQRGTGAISCPNLSYTYVTDRNMVFPSGATVNAQYNNALIAPGFNTGTVVTGTSGLSDVKYIQRIESANSRDLAGGSVAIQCWLYQNSGTAATVYATIYRADSNDNFASVTADTSFTLNSTVLPSGVWTKFTGTAALSSSATNGLQVQIGIAGTLTSGSICFTGVQLEKGSTATSFDYRPYGTELALCQRYYELCLDANERSGAGWWDSATAPRGHITFEVTKRATPTMAYVGTVGNFQTLWSGSGIALTALTFTAANPRNAMLYGTVASGGTTGQAVHIIAGTGNQITASAEL